MPVPPPTVSAERATLLRDSLRIRDARGRGRRPALVYQGESRRTGSASRRGAIPLERALQVRGPFTVLQSFWISANEGRWFVETSRDSNPIHTEGRVVPGAMTAARHLLLPEILLPGTAVTSMKIKFRAFAYYDQPSVNVYEFRPEEPEGESEAGARSQAGELTVCVRSYQNGALVAESSIRARRDPTGIERVGTVGDGVLGDVSVPQARRSRPEALESEECVRRFLSSLRIDSEAYLRHLGHGYPRAFLASLPSGAMVRLGGEGGLLNVLDFKFPDTTIPALGAAPPPVAQVEPRAPRRNFHKVLTRVCSGIRTYCEGYATVLAAVLRGPELSGPVV